MSPREPPRAEVIKNSDAGVVRPPDPAWSEELPTSVLFRMLAHRAVMAVRHQADRVATATVAHATLLRRFRSVTAARALSIEIASSERGWARTARLRRGLRAMPRPRFRLAVIALAVLVPPLAYLAYCTATLPSGGRAAQPTPGALVVQTADGRALATRGIFKGERIEPDNIPPFLASAVIAIEDRRFYQHGGIDLRATLRAAWHDLTGHKLEGGSTITQQLARLTYLTPERTLKRKVQEAVLALWLDHRLSKPEILARYLDSAYFGYGAYGADAAAKRYFGKPADQLSLSEAAMLAGLIRAPSALEPDRNIDRARARANIVLDAMMANGTITQQQADAARQNPAALRLPAEPPPGTNYFIDTAAAEVKARTGGNAEDLMVRTTLNRDLQQIAERVIAKQLEAGAKSRNAHQAALVAMAPDGAILAMVGGRDYNESQYNRVTQARRQPGSLFKLVDYLAALRQGFTPDSVAVDQPISIGNWQPKNYGGRYYGTVTLRTAFAKSLNSIAVQLAQTVGIPTVIDTARQLGIRSDLPAVPSIALGSANVTLLEMTRAFAAVATNRAGADAYTVRDIKRGDQTVYERSAPQAMALVEPRLQAEMVDLMSGAVREGTGRAARLDEPVAGKTGTSQDYRDAWFIGFTPDLIVGVWVGNDDNSPMNSVTGGSIPASIWHNFVSGAEPVLRSQRPVVGAGTSPSVTALARNAAPEWDIAAPDRPILRGKATVLDGGALELQGHVIHLFGVDGADPRYVYILRRALRDREMTCAPTAASDVYQCQTGEMRVSGLLDSDSHAQVNADSFVNSQETRLVPRRRAVRHFWPFHLFHW